MHYARVGPARGRLIVAGATGVPQRFYSRFAQFVASQGIDVWTLDYRGIGLSRPPSLRGFRMDYMDWARRDLAALLDHVAAQADGPIWMVGHSYGGHAFGLLPGHERIERFATFATGAGWHGWMPPAERLRVIFLWRVLGPLVVRANGYLAWSLLGMGEDLPRDVFYQWRRWCQQPNYFFGDPALPGLAEQFDLLAQRGQAGRRRRRSEKFAGVRLEGEHGGRQAAGARHFAQARDEGAMPAVHAVEVADRQGRRARYRL